MRVDDDTAQRTVLGPYDARAVLVRWKRSRAADEPREERGTVRAHHAQRAGASAGAGVPPPATRAPLRITRPAAHSRTRTSAATTNPCSSYFLTSPRTLSLHIVMSWSSKLRTTPRQYYRARETYPFHIFGALLMTFAKSNICVTCNKIKLY